MALTGAILPKNMPMQLPNMNKRKQYFPVQHQSLINKKKQKTETFLSYPIYFPLCNIHQRKQIKMKFTQLRIYFNVVCQVNIVKNKASKERGHLISKVHNTEVKWSTKSFIFRTKKVSKELRQNLVGWIMKNSNVHESPIACDTLLITDAESGVKWIVPKIFLKCSM